jgi:pantoate--beta-alanine ligase
MIKIERIQELRDRLSQSRREGNSIGYVPTMGFLHEGHMQLVDAAKRDNDVVVVSIFVNPLQFGPNEDLEQYPRDLERDMALLNEHGCDILFYPPVDEMYPLPMATVVDLAELGKPLCGQTRPFHFRGVSTVVCKLFNIVQPDFAYFGQKDGQQLAVIRRMVQDLSMSAQIRSVETVREPDGLAKSSRNVYLTDAERPHATVLARALQAARQRIENGERDGAVLAQEMAGTISTEPGVRLDYAEVVSLNTLQPAEHLEGPVMLAVAAFFEKARLIDNVQLTVNGDSVEPFR